MNIVTYLNAPVIRFISLDEMLPKQIGSMMQYVSMLKERYSFANVGESQNAATMGVVAPAFNTGTFKYKGERVPIIALEFTPARVTAICTTSDQSQAFLDEVLKLLIDNCGFREPKTKRLDFIASSIVVDFGSKGLKRIVGVASIIQAIRDAIGKSGLDADLNVQGLRLAGAIEVAPGTKLAIHYALEERANRPPGTNWLFSQAPLATAEHEAFLRQIEGLLVPQDGSD